ncbi:ABC transporter ATP-binding protein [Corynebacterium pelargi]|uniref:ABC transporter ATP-binding protein YxdL n=1 Tax=Corynebacterium pelargi TaxID=1471400 RepID=A0A410WA23_9CORY|nr:ABC transporter ATP-binding protein [Corynebacterium pelargi]QAU52794.1 ABC transporter ATP-binding protein YxdL [Corynebacterium pelargi]GGG78820.1 macrolide ABC transporter ATP-binding protein [Corynebacterium pelargi]
MNLPIELRNVNMVFGSKAYPVQALCDASLKLHPGELIAVMGPSGSGKSTLLNVAGLLQRPNSGAVLVHGEDTAGLSDAKLAAFRRTKIGVVFQRFNLVPELTVAENISLPLELDGQTPSKLQEAISEALDSVGLEGLEDRFPDEISGGQQQRVAIARALIGSRDVLLADEPTGALDTATSDAVMKVLRERVDHGAAGLLVTHEARFAGWADRVVYMRDGRLSEDRGV